MSIEWNKHKTVGKINVNGEELTFMIFRPKGLISWRLFMGSVDLGSSSDKEFLHNRAEDYSSFLIKNLDKS